ncbi:MAG: hypothetical protein SFZ23_01280 [Planctomycetota bacterium]|nr:hypothetical protein [Planctomycetota bacterium]
MKEQLVDRRMQLSIVLAAGLAATGLVSSATLAQGEAPLSGPKSRAEEVPGQNKTFADARARYAERSVGQEEFLRAFRVLRGDAAAPEVKLTGEQEEKLRELERSLRQEQREYVQSHRAELATLGQTLGMPMPAMSDEPGKARENERAFRQWMNQLRQQNATRGAKGQAKADAASGKTGDQMQGDPMGNASPEDRARDKARDRLRQIFQGAPKPEETQTRMWAVLSPEQQKLVRAEVDRVRAEQNGRAGEALRERMGKADKPLTLDDPRIPERLRERIKNMSPEDREKAMERLRQRLDNQRNNAAGNPAKPAGDAGNGKGEGGKGKSGKGRGKSSDAKPAPSMDEVDVPSPDEPSPMEETGTKPR